MITSEKGNNLFLIPRAIEWEPIPPLLRIMLTTDNSVTSCLEAYFLEEIDVEIILQKEIEAEGANPLLDILPGDNVIERLVVIQGRSSGRKYLLAQSMIGLKNIDDVIKKEILSKKMGIGDVLRGNRVETYREILDISHKVVAEPLLGVDTPERLLTRRYRIIVGGYPAILISEQYTEAVFRQSP